MNTMDSRDSDLVGIYSEQMQCEWLSWLAISEQQLTLLVPTDSYPDMTGCVAVAVQLMPSVEAVYVVDASAHRTIVSRYELHDGRWQSMGRGDTGLLL